METPCSSSRPTSARSETWAAPCTRSHSRFPRSRRSAASCIATDRGLFTPLVILSGGTTASFPSLTTITRRGVSSGFEVSIDVQGTSATDIAFGSLVSPGGWLEVVDDTSLTSFTLPTPVTSQYLRFENNDALASLDFPLLATITDGLFIFGNATLASLSAPMLTTLTGPISIVDNPSLPACDVEAICVQTGRGAPSGSCP